MLKLKKEIDNLIEKLKKGCNIIVGTLERIKDIIDRRHIKLRKIKAIILDEEYKIIVFFKDVF